LRKIVGEGANKEKPSQILQTCLAESRPESFEAGVEGEKPMSEANSGRKKPAPGKVNQFLLSTQSKGRLGFSWHQKKRRERKGEE